MCFCAVHRSSSCGSWWRVVGFVCIGRVLGQCVCEYLHNMVSVRSWFCWNPEEPAAPESFCVQLRVPQNSLTSSEHAHLYSNTNSPLVTISFLQSFCSFFSRFRLKIFERLLVVQRFTAPVDIFIACFQIFTFCLWFLILQVYTVVAHWHVVFQCSWILMGNVLLLSHKMHENTMKCELVGNTGLLFLIASSIKCWFVFKKYITIKMYDEICCLLFF